MIKLVQTALDVAETQINVMEVVPNAGPKVDEYLRSTGLPGGNPWCAAYVYWCINEAAKQLGVTNPFVRTAGCAVIDAWAMRNGIKSSVPMKGDVFLRYGTVNGIYRACHTGFVTKVNGAKFDTIEGNTNLTGRREGIGVFHQKRTNSNNYAFVRWGDIVDDADVPGIPAATYKLFVSGSELCDMPIREGRALCPVRLWGERLGFVVDWNTEEQTFLFDGQEVPTEPVFITDKAYAPVRDLVESAGLQLRVDPAARRVDVTKNP